MNLVDKMFELRPEKNPVFTAIDTLKHPNEIAQFKNDYRRYMIKEGYTARTADNNISYIIGYYDSWVQIRWGSYRR